MSFTRIHSLIHIILSLRCSTFLGKQYRQLRKNKYNRIGCYKTTLTARQTNKHRKRSKQPESDKRRVKDSNILFISYLTYF